MRGFQRLKIGVPHAPLSLLFYFVQANAQRKDCESVELRSGILCPILPFFFIRKRKRKEECWTRYLMSRLGVGTEEIEDRESFLFPPKLAHIPLKWYSSLISAASPRLTSVQGAGFLTVVPSSLWAVYLFLFSFLFPSVARAREL